MPLKDLSGFLEETFEREGWSKYRIRAVASIDVKREEPGLVGLSRHLGVPFLTFSKEALATQQGDFSASTFVQDAVGVDNVCERSALCAAISEGWLEEGSRFEDFCRLRKQARNGMTLAVLAICRKTC